MPYINTNNLGGVYGDWDWSLPSSWNSTSAYGEFPFPDDGVVMKKPDSPPLTVPKKIIVPNGQRKLILK